MDHEHRAQQRCDPAKRRDHSDPCGPPPGPQSADATGHRRHDGDGETEILPDSLDGGEQLLAPTEGREQAGDKRGAPEPGQKVAPHDGDWNVTLRMPDRPMPPPPADMTDTKAVAKWRDHCWALRNMYGSGN